MHMSEHNKSSILDDNIESGLQIRITPTLTTVYSLNQDYNSYSLHEPFILPDPSHQMARHQKSESKARFLKRALGQ